MPLYNDYDPKEIFFVKDYGAVGDGSQRLLSDVYSSLANAQMDFPFATSLTQSLDWAAIQKTIKKAIENNYSLVSFAGLKEVFVNSTIFVQGSNLLIDGCGCKVTTNQLNIPVFASTDPSDGTRAFDNITYERLVFSQTATQTDVNSSVFYNGSQPEDYKVSCGIHHGGGDNLHIRNCSFTNFVNGISYFPDWSGSLGGSEKFTLENLNFSSCNFGVWIDWVVDFNATNLYCEDTTFVQISGGSTLPPHLIYITGYGDSTDISISNVVDKTNANGETIKIKNSDYIKISNVRTKSVSGVIALHNCNKIHITDIFARDQVDDPALTSSQSCLNLWGCTDVNVDYFNVDVNYGSAINIIPLDKTAITPNPAVDVQSENIRINNPTILLNTSNSASAFRVDSSKNIWFNSPNIIRTNLHNGPAFDIQNNNADHDPENILINNPFFYSSSTGYDYLIYCETGAINVRLTYEKSKLINIDTVAALFVVGPVSLFELKRGYTVSSGTSVSHTGNTSETALATVTIPAGVMGPNGCVKISSVWSYTNSANNKTYRIRVGGISGTAYGSQIVTTTATSRDERIVINANSVSSQIGGSSSGTGGFGPSSVASVTSSVDTDSDWTIVFTGTLASSGETITLNGYSIDVTYGE